MHLKDGKQQPQMNLAKSRLLNLIQDMSVPRGRLPGRARVFNDEGTFLCHIFAIVREGSWKSCSSRIPAEQLIERGVRRTGGSQATSEPAAFRPATRSYTIKGTRLT